MGGKKSAVMVLLRRCPGMVDGGALVTQVVVLTHAVAIFIIGGVFNRTRPEGPEIVQMTANLSCQRGHLASLHLTWSLGDGHSVLSAICKISFLPRARLL
jgi:hypothetical protein